MQTSSVFAWWWWTQPSNSSSTLQRDQRHNKRVAVKMLCSVSFQNKAKQSQHLEKLQLCSRCFFSPSACSSKAQCYNCGTLNETTCTCDCVPGRRGDSCQSEMLSLGLQEDCPGLGEGRALLPSILRAQIDTDRPACRLAEALEKYLTEPGHSSHQPKPAFRDRFQAPIYKQVLCMHLEHKIFCSGVHGRERLRQLRCRVVEVDVCQ